MLSNVYFSMGQSYYVVLHDTTAACASFEKSRAANRKAAAMNPDRAVTLPAGFKSFDELIDRAKAMAGCS